MKKILISCIAILLLTCIIVSSETLFTKKELKRFSKHYVVEQEQVCQQVVDKIVLPPAICQYHHNSTYCANTSGEGTDCSPFQQVYDMACPTKYQELRQKVCTPTNSFSLTVGKKKKQENIKLDFSDFGPCIHEQRKKCLVITCQSKHDGAHQGEFTSCDGGQSCQQFKFCPKQIRKLVKNSQDTFTSEDASFYSKQKKIDVEVRQ